MIIIVDQNEQDTNPEVVKALRKNFTSVIVTNLPHHEHGGTRVTAGDVNLPLDDGNLLAIERKTPTDFVQSIFSGHLFDQVEIMAQHAKYSAVIVTGRFTYTEKSDIVRIDDGKEYPKWKGAAVRGAITALQYSACPIIFCPPNKYCQMIFEVFNTVNKQDARQTVKKNRIITFPPVDSRVEFIAQLPGIGLKLATSLMQFAGKMDGADADGFGSISSALHWVSILSQIDKAERPAGWTPNKILSVRKFFQLDSNEYLAPVKEFENEVVSVAGQQYVKVPF